MRNYIHADIRRILSRTSHAFSMLLLFAIYALAVYLPLRSAPVTPETLAAACCSTLSTMIIFFGLFEMIGVFCEDFKVKTMQVAIGLGITRCKVVLCKLLEVVILLALDMLVLTAISLGAGALLGTALPLAVLTDLFVMMLVQGVIGCTAVISLTMIVLFCTQSTVLSIFVYMVLGLDVVRILLQLLPLLGFEWLECLHLETLTLSHFVGTLETRLAAGGLSIPGLLGTAAYTAIGLAATCKLFAKRELDF